MPTTYSPHNPAHSFLGLGISAPILAVLEHLHFTKPTPIQHQSIPAGLAGKDIIGIAQTGTGKTLAFGIPLIQRLQAMQGGRALILIPTRELAIQAEEMLQKIGRPLGLSAAVLIGGESMTRQIRDLQRHPRVLVATPGRLLDHLQRRTVTLRDVKILVLDEADRMLDMGFAPQINQIMKNLPTEKQTLLYSATMPTGIVRIATAHMKLPVRVEVAPSGTAAENVEQEIIIVNKDGKQALLETVLQETPGTALVFSRTKHGARKVCQHLNQKGYGAAEIHSNRSQGQRKEAMDGFRRGKYRILVATDIAARGIDVSHIGIVINFDLPDNSEDYVHRIGRTGRAGREGRAISFATPDQRRDIRDIEKLIRKTLKISSRLPASTPGASNVVAAFNKPYTPFKRRFGRRFFRKQGPRTR
ncbi:MAG: DEAD/DEAH box helicase [Deltaproteobacteria bacterium]|nr:DEAD/DEAH box helicase [Deltaproteobacteria bacterium]